MTDTGSGISVIDPSKITQPIQLLAIVLGVFDIALVIAAISLATSSWDSVVNGIKLSLAFICIIVSSVLTYYIINKFFALLKDNPLLVIPDIIKDDTIKAAIIKRKMFGDWDIDKTLAVESAKKESITAENIIRVSPASREAVKDTIMNHTNINLQKTEPDENYVITGMTFLNTIKNCFVELKINFVENYLSSWGSIDFLVTTSTGKNIPVEVKYFQNPVIGSKVPTLLNRQMNLYMEALDAKEAALILSNDIDEASLELLVKADPDKKIHVIQDFSKLSKKEIHAEMKKIFQ